MTEKSGPGEPLQTKNPAILRVSREGREEGLRYYTTLHKMGDLYDVRRAKIPTFSQSIQAILMSHPIYVNFEVDMFSFRMKGFFGYAMERDLITCSFKSFEVLSNLGLFPRVFRKAL